MCVRKLSARLAGCGFALLLLSCLCVVIRSWQANNTGVMLRGLLPVWMISLSVALLLWSAALRVFAHKEEEEEDSCRLPCTCLALGLSAAVALGGACFANWYAIVVFGDIGIHPIRYPACILGGIASLVAVFVLLFLYGRQRRKCMRWRWVALDVLASILLSPSLFILFVMIMG